MKSPVFQNFFASTIESRQFANTPPEVGKRGGMVCFVFWNGEKILEGRGENSKIRETQIIPIVV
jgi:hypothetical protein